MSLAKRRQLRFESFNDGRVVSFSLSIVNLIIGGRNAAVIQGICAHSLA
jgi:hypothetical protein